MFFHKRNSANAGQRLWPVFVLLIAVAALPACGVLWFMNQAMRNEELAAEQRLREIYASQIQAAARGIDDAWRGKLTFPVPEMEARASETFAAIVKNGHADAALFFSRGILIYPEPAAAPASAAEFDSPLWREARDQEYIWNNPGAAAAAYARIAEIAGTRESAMALMAEARCLNKAGRPEDAIEMIIREFSGDGNNSNNRYKNALDLERRIVRANALMFALDLMAQPGHPLFQKTAETLAECLNDYAAPAMPSGQRRFLMRRLQTVWPECPPFPTRDAEELAAPFNEISLGELLSPGQMRAANVSDTWAYLTPDRAMIALFSHNHIMAFMNDVLARQEAIPGVHFSVMPPGAGEAGESSAFLSGEIGNLFPSWKISLVLAGADPFRSAAGQRIALYMWSGVLLTCGVVALSVLLAAWLRRQVRLTRMKNDLIAIVSHELKTPLASMRLLVDTLRDGRCNDARLVEEYTGLMAKENARLSRLIEDFLTFSRMERKGAKFERALLRPREIVEAAIEVVGDRLRAPGCELEVNIAPEIPDIIGDRDALVTALVNLLDNAIKYSGDIKKIQASCFAADGRVCFEVRDNGIGFPRRAAKKIFDRFYQVDRSLSRHAGGCGLGLSIVKFIVTEHGGEVSAQSRPGQGKGSVFTLRLPIFD